MIRIEFSLALVVSTAVLLVPKLASACAVCFTGRADETRVAFLVTTGFLTALPILLVGTLVWWLCRRARQIRDESEAISPAVDRGLPGPRPSGEPIANRRASRLVDLRGQ